MAVDLEDILRTNVMSIVEFLETSGQGCYIPPYQRNYAWGENDITRLFEDILIGINQAKENRGKVTFLGTIIAIHTTDYTTIKPVLRSEVPPRVMTIIDGQQRIATIAMLSIALHDSIRLMQSKLKANLSTKEQEDEEHFSWIIERSGMLLSDLPSSYATDSKRGKDNYRYYPCIIRAYKDTWSSKENTAIYRSPVACLIRDYIAHESSQNLAEFKFEHQTTKEQGWGPVRQAFGEIQTNCQLIQNDSESEMTKFGERINIEEILNHEKLLKNGFWHDIIEHPLSEEVKNYILRGRNQAKNKEERTAYDCVCGLFRLIIFTFYLRNCVATVIVSVHSEEDAFDMFESLNTTGQPLTAFETFLPKVIEWEKLENYELSPSFKLINRIKEYLDSFTLPGVKQKATAEMLVSFALLETGQKLAKKLNSQRRYLRKQFDTITSNELGGRSGGQNFIQSMTDMAIFMQQGWTSDPDFNSNGSSDLYFSLHHQNSARNKANQKRILREAKEAAFGLRALYDFKHQITIAPLVRFFQFARHQPAGNKKIDAIEQFHQSIRATAAFSFLWRGALGGTSGIDDCYRRIMQGKIKMHDGDTFPALARRSDDGVKDPCAEIYKRTLISLLEGKGINQKDEWVKKASSVPIYHHNQTVARFLLFCAMDDTVEFPGSKGSIKRGKQDSYPLLGRDHWVDEKHLTLEHIAPKEPKKREWNRDIYRDKDVTINLLGNLTLLPTAVNSKISNTSWQNKLKCYKSLSNPECDADSTIYLQFCTDIAAYECWSCKIIKNRSKNLAELAWDRLAPWLGLGSES